MSWVVASSGNIPAINLAVATGLTVNQVGADWVIRVGTTGSGTTLPGTYASDSDARVAAQRLVNAVDVADLVD